MEDFWIDGKTNEPLEFEFYGLLDASKLKTNVTPLEIKRETEGNFKDISYFQPTREGLAKSGESALPDDFVFGVFMRLDPENIEGLLRFQNEYGQIVPPVFDTPTGSGDASFMLEPDSKHGVQPYEVGLTDKLNEHLHVGLGIAVPVVEVSRTVTVMQQLIECTIRCRNGNYTFWDIASTETFNKLANRISGRDMPIFGLAKDNPIRKQNTVGLIDSIVLHHMQTLSVSNRKIWKCANCKKYFQYDKRETIYPDKNHFCSPECSSRFHQRKYDRKKRKAGKTNGEG